MFNTGQILKIQNSTESLEPDLVIYNTLWVLWKKTEFRKNPEKKSCLGYAITGNTAVGIHV